MTVLNIVRIHSKSSMQASSLSDLRERSEASGKWSGLPQP